VIFDGYTLRRAALPDVPRLKELVDGAASQGLLLGRPLSSFYEHLRDFTVIETAGQIVGCSALAISWGDLVEIRSLVVAEEQRGRGLGRRLVLANLEEAEALGASQVFVLTYQVAFFGLFGFREVPRDRLPRKVWADRVNCLKFPDCDEVAMLREDDR
jgi:amino-acid N-acetyltransferase